MTGNEDNQTQAYGVDIWNPNHTSDQCIKSETLQSLFAVLRPFTPKAVNNDSLISKVL